MQALKGSGWLFDKFNRKTIVVLKPLKWMIQVMQKFPSRKWALLNFENDDKFCFLWSLLAGLHPCDKSHSNRVSSYRQYFKGLGIQGFHFTNGFNFGDVHKFEEVNNLPLIIFHLSFCQDQKKWKQKLIPLEVSKLDSNRVFDLWYIKTIMFWLKTTRVFR